MNEEKIKLGAFNGLFIGPIILIKNDTGRHVNTLKYPVNTRCTIGRPELTFSDNYSTACGSKELEFQWLGKYADHAGKRIRLFELISVLEEE